MAFWESPPPCPFPVSCALSLDETCEPSPIRSCGHGAPDGSNHCPTDAHRRSLMVKGWVGVDIGKTHHHIAAVDARGTVLFSERVDNDQHAITSVIARFTRRAGVCWAVDMTSGPAGLLLALLLARHADVRYVSGSLASKMAAAFHGERKTDAKDAVAIAQTARVHPGLTTVTTTDTTQAQLRLLTARRNDLVHERIRTIMRLQDLLTSISPALARALD